MAYLPTIYVISTSTETAERHAALDPDVWFPSEAEARAWLATRDEATQDLFQVYEVTRRLADDGPIYIARSPVTMAGALARACIIALSFAAMLYTTGVASWIGGA